MKKTICYCVFIVIVFFHSSCNEWYNNSLGNNLSLWDGDTKEDRIIVYCTGDCHGGIPVVPTYKRQFDKKGNYAEYVEAATSNKKWVIAKTFRIKEKQENYWIISKDFNITNLDCSKANCDSILQRHVIGPLNLTEFNNRLQSLSIELNFK